MDENPEKTFDRIQGNYLEDAYYGPDQCYFVNRQDQGGREYVAYRARYEDRTVRVVARSPGKIKLQAPYFFLQQSQNDANKKTRTYLGNPPGGRLRLLALSRPRAFLGWTTSRASWSCS